MQKSLTITKYLIAIVVILTLAGLLGWYYFLKSRTTTITVADAGRGFDSTAPSFTGTVGSTHENIAQATAGDSSVSEAGQTTSTSTPPVLWRVSQTPTAGMGFVKDTSSLTLNFTERASGNVFSADLATGRVERITNTLLPKVYIAAFTNDGAVALQSINAAGKTSLLTGTMPAKKVLAATEIASSSPSALKGAVLSENVTDLAVNPKAHEVFYILPDAKVGAIGIKSAWDGTKQKRVLESGIIGWHPTWLSDGRIILTQYPAYNIAGSAFILETTGLLTPIVRNVPGLTLLPHTSSKTFVYGSAANDTLALYVQKDKKEPELLPIKTIADKCVWAPKKEFIMYCAVPQTLGSGNFIDNWLQGRIHTSDTWWEVNTADDTAQVFFVSEDPLGNSIDVIQPTIDESGSYISFMNGVDLSLWVLRIPADTAAMTAPHQ